MLILLKQLEENWIIHVNKVNCIGYINSSPNYSSRQSQSYGNESLLDKCWNSSNIVVIENKLNEIWN